MGAILLVNTCCWIMVVILSDLYLPYFSGSTSPVECPGIASATSNTASLSPSWDQHCPIRSARSCQPRQSPGASSELGFWGLSNNEVSVPQTSVGSLNSLCSGLCHWTLSSNSLFWELLAIFILVKELVMWLTVLYPKFSQIFFVECYLCILLKLTLIKPVLIIVSYQNCLHMLA